MSHPLRLAPRGGRSPAERGSIILKLIGLVLVLALLVTLYALRRPLLRTFGELWVVDEALQPADAIVLLSGDNYHADRAARAAALYHDRWAPRIIASGGYVRPYASHVDLARRDLAERAVPAEGVVPYFNLAGNTREEAYAVRQLLRERKWTRVIVVTSNYHTRRARYIWTRAADPATQVRFVAAPDAEFDPRTWWQSRHSVKLLAIELIGFVVAVVEMHTEEPDIRELLEKPAPTPAPQPPK